MKLVLSRFLNRPILSRGISVASLTVASTALLLLYAFAHVSSQFVSVYIVNAGSSQLVKGLPSLGVVRLRSYSMFVEISVHLTSVSSRRLETAESTNVTNFSGRGLCFFYGVSRGAKGFA